MKNNAVFYTNLRFAKNFVEPVIIDAEGKYNAVIVKSYYDINPGPTVDNPEFKKMVKYIKRNNIKIVFFYNTPKLNMNPIVNKDVQSIEIRVVSRNLVSNC